MINAILAIIITLVISPLAYFIFSYIIYKKEKHKKFPTSYADFFGDVLFLPIFNGLAVYYGILPRFGINFLALFVAFMLAVVVTGIFIHTRKNLAKHNDWTRPKRGIFNVGGWYQTIYFFLQAMFLFFSLLILYKELLLWVFFALYSIFIISRYFELIGNESYIKV